VMICRSVYWKRGWNLAPPLFPVQHFTPLHHFADALTYRRLHTDILMEIGTPHTQPPNLIIQPHNLSTRIK